jgi:ketosteroid isomerase-like protein
MEANNIALKYLDSFSEGDPDIVAALVTEDFINDQVGLLGARFQGRSLYRDRLDGFLNRFQGIRYKAEQVIAEGENLAVVYTLTAMEDKSPIVIRGVMVITIKGNLIKKRSDYWDGLNYLAQSGIV